MCALQSGAGQESGPFKDGGLIDRTGLSAWRKRRSLRGKGVPPALIHLIQRSSNFSGSDDVEATGESSLPHTLYFKGFDILDDKKIHAPVLSELKKSLNGGLGGG